MLSADVPRCPVLQSHCSTTWVMRWPRSSILEHCREPVACPRLIIRSVDPATIFPVIYRNPFLRGTNANPHFPTRIEFNDRWKYCINFRICWCYCQTGEVSLCPPENIGAAIGNIQIKPTTYQIFMTRTHSVSHQTRLSVIQPGHRTGYEPQQTFSWLTSG